MKKGGGNFWKFQGVMVKTIRNLGGSKADLVIKMATRWRVLLPL